MRTYALVFDDYNAAFRALRKLRKRGVVLHYCVMIVSTEHWNKVKDMLNGSDWVHLPQQRQYTSLNDSRKIVVLIKS